MTEISYPQSIGTERELLDAHLEFAREMVIQSIEDGDPESRRQTLLW